MSIAADRNGARRPATPALVDLLEATFTSPSLEALLDIGAGQVSSTLWERALAGPARNVLARPGKQIRGHLVEVAWELAGGPPLQCPSSLAHVVELLHAGSLIVDDIEDGSETRRGSPALHRVVGTPLALNTGNWMYFWPLVLLSELGLPATATSSLQREAALTLMRCHHGQALDLALRVDELAPGEIAGVVEAVTRLKTGALMQLAAVLGATAAGAEPTRVGILAALGRDVGVALQMLDDLGGLSRPDSRHKGVEDLRLRRVTWPWAWAAEILPVEEFVALREETRVAAAGPDPTRATEPLLRVLDGRGRTAIRELMNDCLSRTESALGPGPILGRLRAELRAMETSYV